MFRWSANKDRVAGTYIRLSDLRLEILVSDAGRVYFSSAAPIVYISHGRSQITLLDEGLMTAKGGNRYGINALPNFLDEDRERPVPTERCKHTEVTDDCPADIAKKVISISSSPVIPVSKLIVPEMLRMTKHPENLSPIYNIQMLSIIGGNKNDDSAQLKTKFLGSLDRLGTELEEGWLLPNEYIAAGGCVVVPSKGITMRTGSVVCIVPLCTLTAEIHQRRWQIHLGG